MKVCSTMVALLSTGVMIGCVASFDVGAHVMRDVHGDVGVGPLGGAGGGVELPRGALVLSARYSRGVSTSSGDSGALFKWELRWLDAPGPWSPRVGLGFGILIPYRLDPLIPDMYGRESISPGAWSLVWLASVAIARQLYRVRGEYIAVALELTGGYQPGGYLPAGEEHRGWVGLLTLSVILEHWPTPVEDQTGDSPPARR